ncbi:amino acid-binding protein [Aeromicrobium chenweiae]|uniref:Amino acid-binding protein n=1 Tax=Aeromicrobium chenweiae TaxID=2079793 RepID=A0A2S0WHX3_9ACTN|nr:amino acid-binding protein [Aeromicrobium chenweiae]AWB90892.1 amino acid-binding protein [Aeromicrobium chenweiae]TGN32110.1 amino acid-binding protein [Aeromicrobium chenweiae]
MAFLLRVVLPDVPGSLGTLATALGGAGADIEAIEIVERRSDGTVVDDVLLELPARVMPDALITACHRLEGVTVDWISRYNAGASLSMDLEAVERFTEAPPHAIQRLVEVVPETFRTDWAMALKRLDGRAHVIAKSATAPELVEEAVDWLGIRGAKALREVPAWDSTLLAACPARDRRGDALVVVVGRHGGPEFLKSELARLGHMVSLAASVQAV